ncbi:Mitotic-spindle organizing protein 1B, partial [Mucuna pruriens]
MNFSENEIPFSLSFAAISDLPFGSKVAEIVSRFFSFFALASLRFSQFDRCSGRDNYREAYKITAWKKTNLKTSLNMDPEAARAARESLDLAFHMSNILDTGLDRHTLSVLIALCDLGINPEALAAVVKELRKEKPSLSSSLPEAPSLP